MKLEHAQPKFLSSIRRRLRRLRCWERDMHLQLSTVNCQLNNMPLYEFRCNDCGIFDEWRTMAESSKPAHCPSCQASAKRIFSNVGIQLNGALRLNKTENSEPQLVTKQEADPDKRTKAKSHGGRPWMIGH